MAGRKAAPTRMQKSGNGHSYYLDGEWCPGVTTILSNGIPKNGLIGWASKIPAEFVANRLTATRNSEGKVRIVADELITDLREWQSTRSGKDVVRWSDHDTLPRAAIADALSSVRYRDLDEASGKGTDVHKLAERLAHGEEVDVPDHLAGHVKSYLQFLEEWQPYDAMIERVLINRRWRYMGKCDLIASVDNLPEWIAERIGKTSGRGLLDVKTSRSGIFSEVALQLEAYRRCETMLQDGGEVQMPEIDFVAAVHVRSDGYDVYAFDIKDDRVGGPSTFDVFLYCKQVGDFLDWKSGASATIKSPSLHPRRSEQT